MVAAAAAVSSFRQGEAADRGEEGAGTC